jgi:hypothetical protein
MRRQALLLLTTMAFALAVAGGMAMAEEALLDRNWETNNGTWRIDDQGGYQEVLAGTTGTLNKVEVLVGCCTASGTPAGDLRVTVTGPTETSSEIVPKESFTNDRSLHWEEVNLGTPVPVETNKFYRISVKNTSSAGPFYMWGVDVDGGFAWGTFYECYRFVGSPTCDETARDANFRTYVTPGADVIPPETWLDRGNESPGSTISFNDVTFRFYAPNESSATFECKKDDDDWEACTSPKTYTDLSDGSHTLQARAKDASGNVDPTPVSLQFNVDTTPPNTTITSYPADPSDDSTPTFEFTSNETPSSRYGPFECRYPFFPSGGNWIKCSSPYTLSGVSASGTYTFEVRAIDDLNHPDPTPASYTWTYEDPTAPSAPIITGPADNSYDNDGSFTVSGTAEANSTVELFEVDPATGGSTATGTPTIVGTSGTWSIPLSGVAEGNHTYVAKATDAAGNVSAESEARSVRVDTTAPSAPFITSPTNGSILNVSSFTLYGTAEANSTVELFDDSTSKGIAQANASGQWSIALSGVADGSHAYTAKAKDASGNVSEESLPRTLIVDATAPPVPTVSSPINNSFDTDGTITISGTAETNSTVEVFEATASGDISKGTTEVNASGAWTKTLSGVPDGSHSYKVKGKDAAGNTSGFSNARTVVVDKVKPNVSTTTPTGTGVARGTSATATFSERMDPTTITTSTFKLFRCSSTTSTNCATQISNVTIARSTDRLKATLNPYGTSSTLLAGRTKFKVVVTTGAQDEAGNQLDQDSSVVGNQQKVWYFTTGRS